MPRFPPPQQGFTESAPRRTDLAVIIPTFNERGNIVELIALLEAALEGISWEIVFVDDDSPDETADLIAQFARRDSRIRLIHRIGRRGLSSACIEGILSSTANSIAVMDADMQHDEAILPRMFDLLRTRSLDLVVATRNSCGGSMGQFSRPRILLSRMGKRFSHTVCQCPLSDPMSGFFLVRRSFFNQVVHRLHGGGFKILVDMLSCAEHPVRLEEVGYTFRRRRHGESKLDVNTAIEYFMLVLDKLTHGVLPVRFTAFALVGAAGIATHLAALFVLMRVLGRGFVSAQIAATFVAMTENFFLNNLITWRDRSLHGIHIVSGLLCFWLACSFGAWADVVFARHLFQTGFNWPVAGIAGIVLSSVWNYSMSSFFIWQAPFRAHTAAQESAPLEGTAVESGS